MSWKARPRSSCPDTGESVELRAGDVGYFRAGTKSIWTITQPFKKFTVIAN